MEVREIEIRETSFVKDIIDHQLAPDRKRRACSTHSGTTRVVVLKTTTVYIYIQQFDCSKSGRKKGTLN